MIFYYKLRLPWLGKISFSTDKRHMCRHKVPWGLPEGALSSALFVDILLFIPIHLTSSFAVAIITTATRGRCPIRNVNTCSNKPLSQSSFCPTVALRRLYSNFSPAAVFGAICSSFYQTSEKIPLTGVQPVWDKMWGLVFPNLFWR